ncbi:MAG TPA: hypothetical protein VMF10_09165, partial [Candidatus Aquilonibacter sp.]|nr:hypothetical protein [Candidatus Aquilonibacter sp.]
MSRIHEALKKAEEERALSQGSQPSSFPPAVSASAPAAIVDEAPASAASSSVPFSAPMPSFGSPFTLDTLLARAPQLDWQPDGKTMLFFNGNESA